jgi:cytoskeletal protein CcmA (bactofilin family)
MWKSRPDEKPVSPTNPVSATPALSSPSEPAREVRPPEPPKKNSVDAFRGDVAAHIGKSVLIKGELSGNEDLYLDGEVEGTVDMSEHSLVIGPNARLRAHISAREIVLHGRVEGNVHGSDRVELKKSCVLVGDISTKRIVIEDGAYFKGSIDLQKDQKIEPQKETRPELRKAAMAGAQSTIPSGAANILAGNGETVGTTQTSLLEQK